METHDWIAADTVKYCMVSSWKARKASKPCERVWERLREQVKDCAFNYIKAVLRLFKADLRLFNLDQIAVGVLRKTTPPTPGRLLRRREKSQSQLHQSGMSSTGV